MNDNQQNQSGLTTLLLILGLFLVWSNPEILSTILKPQTQPAPVVAAKIIRATYVFEKDESDPPAELEAALRDFFRSSGVACSAVDQDVENGDGEIPKQYATAIVEAKIAGLPALVIEYDHGVPKVLKSPSVEDFKKAVAQ